MCPYSNGDHAVIYRPYTYSCFSYCKDILLNLVQRVLTSPRTPSFDFFAQCIIVLTYIHCDDYETNAFATQMHAANE